MITVLGASGFIGGRLVGELDQLGLEYAAPDRAERLEGRALGHLVYCAGVTEDFRRRPLDTVAGHVSRLESILRTSEVRSLVYLSSTRIYRSSGTATENDVLQLDPGNPDHLYDLSKALGESLALSADVPVVVMRLSNVYGLDIGSRNFLASILQDVVRKGEVTLRTTLDSTRNYVSVDNVVTAILGLMRGGAHGTYNIAGARAVANREITDLLSALSGCAVRVVDGGPHVTAPEISIAKVSAAIDYSPESVVDALPRLVDAYRLALSRSGGARRRRTAVGLSKRA
jgi:nucleoside-diphosphate-sugar epimerase